MQEAAWPYNLPIWRRYHRAASPDGKLVACIDPAWEVSMGNPTSGTLCVSQGPHISRCNPSFVWSDDSRFLAVPQFFSRFGLFPRQRLLVLSLAERQVHASKVSAWYYQPETFVGGTLTVSVNPFRYKQMVQFKIPSDLGRSFTRLHVPWPEMAQHEGG